jgi:hypothetical protein
VNLYEHFSCHTVVPVKIQDVIDLLLDQKAVDEIRLIGVDTMDPAYLRGFCHRYWKFPQFGEPHSFADIYYSTQLSPEWQRVVISKELTHATNGQASAARTRQQVDSLIRGIVSSGTTIVSVQHQIDVIGILHGLCVLFPRDAAVVLREMQANGKTHKEIAKITALPAELMPLLLSPQWEGLVESIV